MAKKNRSTHSKPIQGVGVVGKTILVLACILIATISIYALVFLILSMMPAVVASVIDRGHGKCASKTIGAFNFMGVLPFLFELWKGKESVGAVQNLITDPYVWLLCYGAAAFGWMMVWIMPQFIAFIFTARAQIKISSLKEDQQKLVDEWGEEIRRTVIK